MTSETMLTGDPASTADQVHEAVREHYAKSALNVIVRDAERASCCGADASNATEPADADNGASFYPADDQAALPEAARLASLGCGNPIAVAELREGERVLDLGSGGGIDVLLSARRVGPTGRAFGLDMTDEMLALAQRNQAAAGVTNVEWLKGTIEQIPLPAASIDVVISNCVVNLAADKRAVFREVARVLRPGGRIGIADIVADDSLTAEERAERGTYTGCIAGALTFSEFETGLRDAGLADVSITVSHQVADRMFSVIVKATKAAPAVSAEPARAGESSAPFSPYSCCG